MHGGGGMIAWVWRKLIGEISAQNADAMDGSVALSHVNARHRLEFGSPASSSADR
jgi:hypothetical protein